MRADDATGYRHQKNPGTSKSAVCESQAFQSGRLEFPMIRLKAFGWALPLMLVIAGCASVPLKQAGTLSSYERLGEQKGNLSKARVYVDGNGLAPLQTAQIVPTAFAFGALPRIPDEADRALVTNAIDRALCVALSDRYQMVSTGQPADLTVRAVVTDILPTNKAMAGVSTVVSLGTGFVLPVGIPRLPIGLGGLAVEAEAVDRTGVQRAAIVWARGANSIQDNPRVSEVGDAYGLAGSFGSEFAQLLVLGKEPQGLDLSLPSGQRLQSWFGGKPKYPACDAFGRAPGLAGVVAGKVGAPPEWTDRRQVPTAQ